MSARAPIIDVVAGDTFARHAANWLAAKLQGRDGALAVALAGGETPRPVYEILATLPLPWPRIHWFWGDERFVPKGDRASNYRMAAEALFARAPVPARNIHPVPTESMTLEEAARAYEDELRRLGREPLFDAMFLGVGAEGHTASLFPGGAALEEQARWVLAVVDSARGPRITLTLPALGSSNATAFLATGAEKRAALKRILAGDRAFPAACVTAVGELRFILDRDAAP
jgi:6-phosphogluconolactonase